MNSLSVIRPTLFIPALSLVFLAIFYSESINLDAFLLINGVSGYTGESIWAYLTLFGDPFVAFCLALILIKQYPRIALAMVPAVIIGSLFIFPLKHLFDTLRPEFVLTALEFNTIGTPPTSPALPSGHTTGAFIFATLLMLNINKFSITVLLSIIALVVGSARIVVGAHWPIDVAGGIVVGWLSAVIGFLITKNSAISTTQRHVLMVALLTASSVLIFRDTGYPQAELLKWLVILSGITISVKHFINHRFSSSGI